MTTTRSSKMKLMQEQSKGQKLNYNESKQPQKPNQTIVNIQPYFVISQKKLKDQNSQTSVNQTHNNLILKNQSPKLQNSLYSSQYQQNNTGYLLRSIKKNQNYQTSELVDMSSCESDNDMEIEEMYANQEMGSPVSFGNKKNNQDSMQNSGATRDSDFQCEEEFHQNNFYRFDYEQVLRLQRCEQNYHIPLNFLQNHQLINPKIRAYIINWMQTQCMDLQLKRSTFYNSIYCLDKYISLKKDEDFQKADLLAGAIIFIMAKKEETIEIKISQILESLQYTYRIDQIKSQELEILVTLKFQLSPVTLDDYLLICTKQWDTYLQTSPISPISQSLTEHKNFFRVEDRQCLINYQQLCVVVDSVILVSDSHKYKKLEICAAIIYLVLTDTRFNQNLGYLENNEQLYELYHTQFESYYDGFLNQCLGTDFKSIKECVKFVNFYLHGNMVVRDPYSFNCWTYEDLLSSQFKQDNILDHIIVQQQTGYQHQLSSFI